MDQDHKTEENEEAAVRFDMYRLFSRWDFWLAVIFIVGLLLYTLGRVLFPPAVV